MSLYYKAKCVTLYYVNLYYLDCKNFDCEGSTAKIIPIYVTLILLWQCFSKTSAICVEMKLAST